jgi:hypothetical protein
MNPRHWQVGFGPWPNGAAVQVVVAGHDAALEHGAAGGHLLAHHHEPELVQAAERRQVRRAEGSVVHVEIFRTGWCTNPHHRQASTPTHPPTRRPTPSRRYTSDRMSPAPRFGCGSRCPV